MARPDQPPTDKTLAEKVELLPRYDGNGFAKLGESVIVQAPNGRYVLLDDIRALLAAEAA